MGPCHVTVGFKPVSVGAGANEGNPFTVHVLLHRGVGQPSWQQQNVDSTAAWYKATRVLGTNSAGWR